MRSLYLFEQFSLVWTQSHIQIQKQEWGGSLNVFQDDHSTFIINQVQLTGLLLYNHTTTLTLQNIFRFD